MNTEQNTESKRVIERISALRSSGVAAITAADNKAMAILTISGAMLAIMAIPLSSNSSFVGWAKWSFLGFCLCDVIAIALASWAILPRLDRSKLLKHAKWTDGNAPGKSLSYFGDTGRMTNAAFLAAINASDDEVMRDDVEQAFLQNHIALTKMHAIWGAVAFLAVGLMSLMLALVSMALKAGV